MISQRRVALDKHAKPKLGVEFEISISSGIKEFFAERK
jgi:hypothetical protein